jgi:hypothetical protein
MSAQTSARRLWAGSWTLIEAGSEWSSFSVTTFTTVLDVPLMTSERFAQMRGLVAVGSSAISIGAVAAGRDAAAAPAVLSSASPPAKTTATTATAPRELAALIEAFLGNLR